LRAAEEIRATQFGMAEGELDAEIVAVAKAIITQRTGGFDPTTYRDRYQEALRELIEAKMKELTETVGNMRRGGQPPGPTLSPRADIPGASRVLEAADRFGQHVLGEPEHDVGEEDAERDNREEDRIERQ
jgi:hypothetical protein